MRTELSNASPRAQDNLESVLRLYFATRNIDSILVAEKQLRVTKLSGIAWDLLQPLLSTC